jgi:predicted DNA binding CopG/RHH family protein
MKAKKAKIALDTPEFRSEAEEAAWWDRHQNLIADLLIKRGQRRAVPTKPVSMRVPVIDIERARKIADETGVPYQVVMKDVLHEGLKRKSPAIIRHRRPSALKAAAKKRIPKSRVLYQDAESD